MDALIYKQICEVMGKISAISKGRQNKTQNFVYRGIDDVMNELHNVLAECKVFVVPEVMEEHRSEGKTKSGGVIFYTRMKIKFTFYAEDGSNVSAVVIGEAMDSGDKASNKALSIGLKYALLQVFCIPTEDDKDPDGSSHEVVNNNPVDVVKKTFNGKEVPPKAPPAFKPKGGPDTPEEKKRIIDLLHYKNEEGQPVFTKEEFNNFCESRKNFTAKEVIQNIVNELGNRGYLAEENPPEPPQEEFVYN